MKSESHISMEAPLKKIAPSSSTEILFPAIFVMLWSTGFIGAKFGLPYAEPFTFLFYRMVLVLLCLCIFVLIFPPRWPRNFKDVLHNLAVGILIHGVYLGATYYAIDFHMPSGVTSAIVGLQPLLTAMLAGPLLGERPGIQHWIGIVLGLIGIGLVLYPKLYHVGADALTIANIGFCLLALLGITLGTVYQKAFVKNVDLTASILFQYAGAGLIFGIGAVTLETMDVNWTGEFILALGWLVLVLSLGAISLLMIIIRRGELSKIVSLFYLVPSVTALMAYGLFHETLVAMQIVGMLLTSTAIWFAMRRKKPNIDVQQG